MPRKWKHDKAPGIKRENKQRLKRQKIRKDFAENMERAEQLSRMYYNAADPADVCPGDLAEEFAFWAFCKYRHDKFKEPITKQHADMDATWREIVVTREACAKATEARTYAKRKEMHQRAVSKFRERKMQQRMERDVR